MLSIKQLFMFLNLSFNTGLNTHPLKSQSELMSLPQNIIEAGNIDRHKVLGNIQIKDIISAPGHRQLRHEENVVQLAENFFNLAIGSKIILNVIAKPKLVKRTNEEAAFEVLSMECFDGHHRLVASLIGNHWQYVKDIPEHRLVILINGIIPGGKDQWARWIPWDVASRSTLEWVPVHSLHATGKTAGIEGAVSSMNSGFAEKDRGVSLGSIARRISKNRN